MKYNLQKTISGDSFSGANFTVTKNGAAIDLTGASIVMTVKKPGSNSGLSVSTPSVITITYPTQGRFSILPFVVGLKPGVYFYSIQITFSTGVKKTYISGSWEIYQIT